MTLVKFKVPHKREPVFINPAMVEMVKAAIDKYSDNKIAQVRLIDGKVVDVEEPIESVVVKLEGPQHSERRFVGQ